MQINNNNMVIGGTTVTETEFASIQNKANITSSSDAPTGAAEGDLWYDTDTGVISNWNGNEWVSMTNSFDAVGGTVTTYSDGGTNYQVHTFTSSAAFNVNSGTKQADVLIVAGGGGGGNDNAGGGGAGGLLYYGIETPKTPNGGRITLTPGSYPIVIGAGGAGAANSGGGTPFAVNGSNTTALGYTAVGGGYGASSEVGAGSLRGQDGGSGGGGNGNTDSTEPYVPGSGTAGQGNGGGTGANGGGGGGGGAGGAGQNGNVRGTYLGGNGGVGLQYSIRTGSGAFYAAGGGGGNENSNYNAQSPASGIGGVTNPGSGTAPSAGVANTGSGGGGGTHTMSAYNGAGGSGIVIIRYEV
jgi:hypothetical protein